jgi:hypothetical protein
MSGFDSRHYQIFWDVVGLEQGPFGLASTIEEVLKRKSIGSGLESQEYGRRDPSCWPRNTHYPEKLALTSPTSGGCLVGIVRSQPQATEFCLFVISFMMPSVCQTAKHKMVGWLSMKELERFLEDAVLAYPSVIEKP